MQPEPTGLVRIVKVPSGEAPFFIRHAWLGLILPCYPQIGRGTNERGVISRKPVSSQRGVSVPQDEALAILCQCNTKAAAWWTSRGYPRGDECFGFNEDEIEIVSGVTHQRIVHVPEEAMGQVRR